MDQKMKAGLQNYILNQEVVVSRSGLGISSIYPFIGCSPDGLVYDEKYEQIKNVIEIKCPYAFKDYNIDEMKNNKDFYMKYDEESQKFS